MMGAGTEVEDPHNEFLWAAAEGGIFAAVALVVFLVLGIRIAYVTACAAIGQDNRIAACGAAGVFTSYFVLCMFGSPFHNPGAVGILFLSAGYIEAGYEPYRGGSRYDFGKMISIFIAALIFTLSAWFGGHRFLSDWMASSIAIGGKLGKAEFDKLKKAADLDPSNIDINNYLGQIAGTSLLGIEADMDGRFRKEAIDRLCQVLKDNPWKADALKTMARIRAFEGNADAARRLLVRYLNTKIEEGDPDLILINLFETFGRHKEAATVMAEVQKISVEEILDKGQKFLDKGEAEKASLYADAAVKRAPMNGDALFLLGRSVKVAFNEGEKDIYRRMHLAYALEHFDLGDWRQAEISVRVSRRYGEGSGESELLAAIIKEALGNGFSKPENKPKNSAFMEKLNSLAKAGKLPKKATTYLQGR